jgi:hypothetical protein
MFHKARFAFIPRMVSVSLRRRGALGSGSDPANRVLLGLYARGHRDFKIFHLTAPWYFCRRIRVGAPPRGDDCDQRPAQS